MSDSSYHVLEEKQAQKMFLKTLRKRTANVKDTYNTIL